MRSQKKNTQTQILPAEPEWAAWLGWLIFGGLLAVMVYSGLAYEPKMKVPVVDHLQVKNYFVECSLSLLLILWAIKSFFSPRVIFSKNPLLMVLSAMLLMAVLSFAWSVFTGHTLTKLLLWFGAGGFIFLYYQTVKSKAQLDYILMGVFWAAFISALIGWGQYLFDWQLVAQAATPSSTFGNRNMACHMAVLGLPTAVYLILARPQHVLLDWLYAVATSVIIAFLFYTTTRGAWGAIGAELLVLGVFIILSGWRYLSLTPNKLAAAVFSVVLFVFMAHLKPAKDTTGELLYNPAEVMDIVTGEFDLAAKNLSTDDYSRFVIWRGTRKLIENKPLIGHGLGTFFYAYPDTYIVGAHGMRYAHNEFLEFMVELGLIGFALLMLVMLVSFYVIFRIIAAAKDHYRIMAIVVCASLVGTAFNSFFSFPFQHIPPYVLVGSYLFILMALYDYVVRDKPELGEVLVAGEGDGKDSSPILSWGVASSAIGFSVFVIAMNVMWQSKIDAMNANIWRVLKEGKSWQPIQLPSAEWQQLPNYNWIFQGAATGYAKYPAISDNAAKTLLKVYPRNYTMNLLLAMRYARMKQYAKALPLMKQAQALCPYGSIQPYMIELNYVLLPQNKKEEALALLAEIEARPEEELAYKSTNYSAIANAYLKLEEKEKSITNFLKAEYLAAYLTTNERGQIQQLLASGDLLTNNATETVLLRKVKSWAAVQNVAVAYKTFNETESMSAKWAKTQAYKKLDQLLSARTYRQVMAFFDTNASALSQEDPVLLAIHVLARENWNKSLQTEEHEAERINNGQEIARLRKVLSGILGQY